MHDICWGEFSVDYADSFDSEFVQHILSVGLAHLHQVALAESYTERCNVLYSVYPPFNHDFLYEGLTQANDPDTDVLLSDYTLDDERAHIRPSFYPDPNTGSADAWRWAHHDESCLYFLNTDNQLPLRECGYVMWDRARLDNWNILHTP